jgi:hypothetical protein
MTQEKTFEFQGRVYRPVKILATGQYQLMRMESLQCYILVSPDGRQAWFHDKQIREITMRNPSFRYTNNPLRDLNKLGSLGLMPFHVDEEYDAPTVLDNRMIN